MEFLKSHCSRAHIPNPYPSILSLKKKEGRTAQGFIYIPWPFKPTGF
jgi:hypothetical protein